MTCAGTETDRYGRTLGVCSAGGEDLNAWLVANGWALAYRRYSEAYVAQEEAARRERKGMHRGAYLPPWDWRRGERLEGEDTFAAAASQRLDAGALAGRLLRGDTADTYGRWLDHSVYVIVDDTIAVSFGDAPGRSPEASGGGRWRGAMVGVEAGTDARITGDALIEIGDFDRMEVDVALTGITDEAGDAHEDLRWGAVPMVDDAFHASDGTGWIRGRFYGPGHQEAGGVFVRGSLTGAFGGSR